ncbi:ABC transporter permease subunit [Paenibacillus yanchengensis]|uniref:ABC transporter permease subunit n=1 Tax=Paenibacillus yanchengensis TaxID=2035833 RepID=A0ABW4YF56_9BACL
MMNKLLAANFTRLWKNKLWYVGIIVMFGWAVIMLVSTDRTNAEVPVLEDFFFQYAPVIGLFCAVFTSMFIGTEYHDGTIRNKIIVGHTRPAIYVANLIVCTVAGLIMVAVWIAVMLAIGIPLLGLFASSLSIILAYVGITVVMIAAFVSIFTLVGMLSQNKAGAAVTTLLLLFVLFFVASYFNNKLHEPEMYGGGPTVSEVDGEISMEMSEPEQNPDYVEGNKRKIYEFIVTFLPTGQGIMMSNMSAVRLPLLPLYSLVIVFATTACGVFLFRRKDIK